MRMRVCVRVYVCTRSHVCTSDPSAHRGTLSPSVTWLKVTWLCCIIQSADLNPRPPAGGSGLRLERPLVVKVSLTSGLGLSKLEAI